MEITWTKTGLTTLEEIGDYIAQDSPANAERFVRQIYEKVDLLADSPRMGKEPPEVEGAGILQIIHGNYRIFYRIAGDTVIILAVIHGKRDFTKFQLQQDL